MNTELHPAPEHLDEPPADERAGEWSGIARRLFVAFLLALALAGVCWKVLPAWGVYIPPAIPLIVFGLILVPYVLTAIQDARERRACGEHTCCDHDEEGGARPMGCCGPRPVGETLRRGGGCCRK